MFVQSDGTKILGFLGSPARPTGMLKAMFFCRKTTWTVGSLTRLTACSMLFFFQKTGTSKWHCQGCFLPEKWPPYFWKPYTSDSVAADALLFSENWPHIFGSPTRLTTLPQAFPLSEKNGPWIFGATWSTFSLPGSQVISSVN